MKRKNLLLMLLLAFALPWAAMAQQTLTVYENGTRVACPTPTGLTASNLTSHGATLTWNGSSDNYILEIADPTPVSTQTVQLLSESFDGDALPDGWSATTTNWSIGSTTNAGGEANEVQLSWSPQIQNSISRLITPAIDLSGVSSVTVSFKHMLDFYSSYYTCILGIATSSDNGNSWNTGWSQGFTSDVDATTISEEIATADMGKANVRFCIYFEGDSYGFDDWYFDDILIESEQIEYAWTTFDNNATSPYTINTLDPETPYMVRVTGNCGGDGYSQPSSPIMFTTLASCPVPTDLYVAPASITAHEATLTWTADNDSYVIELGTSDNTATPTIINFEESFDGDALPDGWSATSTNWSITSSTNAGGEANEVRLYWSPQIQGISRLITPAIDLSGFSSVTVSFKHMLDYYNGSYTRILGIATSSDNGNSWNTGWSQEFTSDVAATTISKEIATTDMGKANVRFCIYFEGDSYGIDYWYFDDFEITGVSYPLVWTVDGTSNTTSYNFANLAPETTYKTRVKGVCGGVDTDYSEELAFTTTEACPNSTNLQANNITINSATLSWEGTSDSYDLQIRPWYAAGDDVLPTGTMQTYTFPLEGTGTGSVVIRHYDVTNMYYLNVDDIVIKNAGGTVIFSQDFESCGGAMPSEFTLIDRDGDGYNWGIRSSGTINGNYCLTSASWDNNAGALYPDNWLILSNIELGGEISFAACGQDPSFSAEKFCVFVLSENNFINVSNLTATTYVAKELVPRTPYDWQVKGHCDEYESDWVASYFETLDDVIVFATDGNWNDEDNWVDWNGDPTTIPTAESKVRIDADAVIPAGYVAYAKRIRFGADVTGSPIGSITMKDGGQLKQDGTVDLTIEKEITGVGTDNWSNEDYKGGWYFIASPLTTTLFTQQNDWAYVDITSSGTYDLYSFDPTLELEWLNYKANSSSFDRLFNGQGYLYANQADVTLHFMGSTALKSLNNTLTKTFEYDGTSTNEFNGWALVGNPFTCNAYINYVDGENVLEADFYVMNTDGDGYELPQSSVALPPLTGAFINYSAAGTVQFSTEALAKSNNSGMLNMTVSQGRGNVDMARIRFGRGHNLKHMSFRQNSSKLFIPQDNDYAVVCTEENTGEMPVSFKAETNGTYTIRFNTENVEFSYLHFIDNLTGNDVNLLETPSYTFNAQTTDYANRFRLVFATGSSVEGDSFSFINGMGNLCIFGIEGEATVQVIDILGHMVSSDTFSGSYERKLNVAPGVYMIRLINGNDVKVQKIVVR